MDEKGMDVVGNKVGPVLEGSTLILTCDIIGGKNLQLLQREFRKIICQLVFLLN